MAHVPCDGCTACCRGTRIALHPSRGDVPSDHKGNVEIDAFGWRLKHKPGTDECVYLDSKGCSIFGQRRRPLECGHFDCRTYAKQNNWKPSKLITIEIINAAKKLCEL